MSDTYTVIHMMRIFESLVAAVVVESYLALVADACPLFETPAHLNGRGVEVQGDRRVGVGVVLNTMQSNGIFNR